MSHLARVIAYREHLTALGITCSVAQTEYCQEAYIRAIMSNHAKYHDGFTLSETETDKLWEQLNRWNSVSPLKARLILESVKLRLSRIRQGIITNGVTPGNEEFEVTGEIKEMLEGQPIPKKVCVVSNDAFRSLVERLQTELREEHE